MRDDLFNRKFLIDIFSCAIGKKNKIKGQAQKIINFLLVCEYVSEYYWENEALNN